MLPYVGFETYKIAYRQEGEGLPVLFLHGFCEDGSLWQPLARALGSEYRLLCPDLPGFGDSDMISPYTVERLAESMEALLDALGIDRCVVVGHSMGGYVGAALAERCPQRLLGLVFFHSHAFADSEERKANRRKSIEFIQRHGVAPFVSHLFSSLFAPAFLQAQPAVVEEFIDRCCQQQSDAVIAASQAMLLRPDRSELLRRADYPVCFLCGEQDLSIPLSISLQQAALPPRSLFCLLPEVGHLGMLEAEADCLDRLRGFLAWVTASV